MDKTHPVDHAVGHFRGDDFTTQLVMLDHAGVPMAHRRRECRKEFRHQRRVVGEIGVLDGILERELRGCENDRELGPREPVPVLRAPREQVIRWQSLDDAIEPTGRLERLDQADQ